jgi:trans-aconitate methyltransferase
MQETVKKSDREAWSTLNLGRMLFTTMPYYDRAVADVLCQLIQHNKDTIVELGCGDGIWLEFLARLFPEKKFVGIEWNKQILSYAREKRLKGFKNVELHQKDATKFFVDCDMFYGFGFIEHFSNPVEVLRKWTEHLSPNGFAVLTVPNLLNSIYASRRFSLPLQEILYKNEVSTDVYGLTKLWSHNTFIKKIMDAGLEILHFRVIDELENEKPLLAVAFKRPVKEVKKWIKTN